MPESEKTASQPQAAQSESAGFNPADLNTSLRELWTLADNVRYLNHGSFGPSPIVVQEAARRWTDRLEQQPMQFFLREMEHALDEATERLGQFLGTKGQHLAFVENATVGMNVVAASVVLAADDEVLLTDHEYGAVQRIWKNACRAAGARAVICPLPDPPTAIAARTAEPSDTGATEPAAGGDSADSSRAADDADDEATVRAVVDAITPRTKLLILSHVSSPTARVLPVAAICRAARKRGVQVCIDGPHAVAMLPVHLKDIGCEYYVASCHKWLCGPFGSGFLYAAPRVQSQIRPILTSWGGSLSGRAPHWKDEFRWFGTHNPARFLAVADAIEFMEQRGLDLFRQRSAALLDHARERLTAVTGLVHSPMPACRISPVMQTFPLPAAPEPPPAPGQRDALQLQLQEQHAIEIPVIHFQGQRMLRVSCHLYNTRDEIDILADALEHALQQERNRR
ncbi:MAG: aminotransferase class V-fold PLP-dependent enzyme [Planctomycetaceae bacterium]|nr:aminotransferase class V-fold PLP-dependent enzyme [Planctomycetaceae bacterium]